MDRAELRFRILFEYYEVLHSEESKTDVRAKINDMDVPKIEKTAASVWLINSGYVNGENVASTSGRIAPFIGRINSDGMNFVESIMDSAFTTIKDEFEDIANLSKTERIKKFSRECLKHPVTAQMCQVTYDAIVTYMSNT